MKHDRQLQIKQMLLQKKSVKITELCDTFDISVETARRDLNKLEEEGLIRRTYGGAVLLDTKDAMDQLPPWDSRFANNTKEKRAIALELLHWIPDDASIFLDSGTSAFEIAKLLREKKNLTVLTNDLRIAAELSSNTTHSIYCIGGLVKPDDIITTGFLAMDFLNCFSHIDLSIISSDGFDIDAGLTEHNVEMGTLKSAIIKKSRQVLVGIDHSKFYTRAFYRVCGIDALTAVVTDLNAPKDILDSLEKLGVKTIQIQV